MHWPSELEVFGIIALLLGIGVLDRLSRIVHLLEAVHRMIFRQIYPNPDDW